MPSSTSDTARGDIAGRIAALDSCALSDALDTLGMPGATLGVRPLWDVRRPVVGRARTIQAGPRRADAPAAHIAAASVDDAGSGEVLVIANDGRLDVSCWGGILALSASSRGIEGVVIDGACRDIGESEDLGFPVFGRAVVPVSARGRIVQLAKDEPVQFGGVTVRAHDWVVADRNGTVFVPAEEAERVVALAERIAAREERMAEAVRSGGRVTDVMHDSEFPSADDPAA
ncbi:RraA family protein [Microbacterium sp. NPDC096154]|uniref:RraA family protein n=1 Tax=Microbacterium sp. NPDC096154 TaxID=3155549 RepID=UPI00331D2CF8